MCAQNALCSRFSIGHFPTLFFGRPGDFDEGKSAALQEFSGAKTEKAIIEWVGKQQST